jgi:outer membrane receptor protein involved in Fe transport
MAVWGRLEASTASSAVADTVAGARNTAFLQHVQLSVESNVAACGTINLLGGKYMRNLKLTAPSGQQLTVLASTVSALLGTTAAQAQDVGDEILVTGSRIVRRDLDASSPIVTVDAQRLENSSTISIESVLNQMPQFVPDGTQFDSGNQSSGAVTLGIATVNLRGIGANRTLVLIDGRRPQPANASLVVDLNTIPSAAIERVETITGGASAVYGADALAGVVNFVLKKDFEGVDMDFQTGSTAEGDGQESRFTTLLGVNGGEGRSNVMFGLEWYKREAVFQKDRDFYRNGWQDSTNQTGGFLNSTGYSPGLVTGSPTSGVAGTGVPATALNRPTQAAVNALFAPYGVAAGLVRNTDEIYFQPDGRPFALNGTNYNGPIMSYVANGDGITGVHRQPNGSLQQVNTEAFAATPSERRSVFGRATVDMNDNLTAFAQATYSNVSVTTRGGYPPAITVWQAPIPQDGARPLPPGLLTLLQSRTFGFDPDGAAGPLPAVAPGDPTGPSAATAPWNIFRGLDFLSTPIQPTTQTDAYQLTAGIQGRFASRDWTWEAYVSTGDTNILAYYDNLPSLQRYQFLAAMPNWGVGSFSRGRNYTVTCGTGLPLFSTVDPDPGCVEAIQSKERFIWDLTQNIAEANLQGKIVDMKNGELRFAAGVTGRENKFRYDPGETNDNVSVIEQPIGIFVSNNTTGSTDVSEVYGEILMPVTARLDLELGYRYSDYDISGGVNTYKTLFDWSATDSVRVRGGYQFATRAPNTEELFAGPRLNTVTDFLYGDPCQASTTATWGNIAANPNRLAVQTLCRQIINRSDANPANDGTSSFDTNSGSIYGPPGPSGFVRPGQPFFQSENEVPHGNANLGVEEAKTWTLGVVFNAPGGLENLTASVDLYDIEIADAIATVDATFVYGKCFNADGASNPTYALHDAGGFCDTITRDVNSGERSLVDAPYKNSGALTTRGIDISTNWTKDLGDNGGTFSINALLTYLDEFKIQDAAGEPILDVRDTLSTTYYGAQYKYKLNTQFTYSFPSSKATVTLGWRYLPSIRSETAVRNPATTQTGAGSYQLFNLVGRYQINEKLTFRGGIDNLLDTDPEVVEARPGVDSNTDITRSEYYDILGRRAYVGLSMSF